ncbi:MAG: insulinase family protein [Candidatus Mcinerneyibacterium aminivorans]|uniref:Insulinase family protein n=1 Tax=Candidatus Mcinerneyibacterium aminivorans TaxID=2703815 RepID=A0A5D0MJ03_9BACT|nr:MAG: insulinase family protein [Candidatus Mcinerneyibacterium aminivorans]
MKLRKVFLILVISFTLIFTALAVDFKEGKTYNGFKLLKKEKISEVDSTGYLFEHVKTGARLFKLQNDNENKAFSIAFKTIPYSDNGIAHVMEHSVLCGSRKYPVKSPFEVLSKGSMKTFLNAMTGSDMTSYPVASTNDKEFKNLMDVYLDAVFFPNIHENNMILKQEGWHYELNSPEDELKVNGIVYNEMKGALSSPGSLLWNKTMSALYPMNTYKYESGGEPEAIKTITQQEFEEFHSKFYHPSNSYIYLYGEGNLNEELKIINKDFLSKFSKKDVGSGITEQKTFDKPKEEEYYYSISKREDKNNKIYYSMGWMINESDNLQLELAFQILNNVLINSTGAPLKTAILENNLGKDVGSYFYDSIKQPMFYLEINNSSLEKKEKVKETIQNTLKDLVKNGIDNKRLRAAIKQYEFKLREADFGSFPKGLAYGFNMIYDWKFGTSPFESLKYEDRLAQIKKNIDTDYFENIVEKYLLNNNHRVFVTLKPQKGLLAEKRKERKEKLQKMKENMSKKELNKIIAENKKLKEYQSKQDDPEDLKKLPLLKLSDIDKSVKKYPVKEEMIKGRKLYTYLTDTNKIAYVRLMFDVNSVPEKKLQYIPLLTYLLEKLDTKNYSYRELDTEMKMYTGGISVYRATHFINNNYDNYRPVVGLSGKSMIEDSSKMMDLMIEIAKNTKFENKERIGRLISKLRSQEERQMGHRGFRVAFDRLQSNLSQYGIYNEKTSGFSYLQFLRKIDNKYSKNSKEVINNLKEIYKNLFHRDNLKISLVTEEKYYNETKDSIASIIEELNGRKIKKHEYKLRKDKKNEAIASSGTRVQYVLKGSNYRNLGIEYTGKMNVVSQILSRDYLHNKIREIGGAYGGFGGFTKNGMFYAGSYRDPSLDSTLKVINNIPEYLKDFKASDREMRRYIIGRISRFSQPRSPRAEGDFAINLKIENTTHEERQKIKNEMLDTTVEDVRSYSKKLEKILKNSIISVYGNTDKVEKNKKYFDEIIYFSK